MQALGYYPTDKEIDDLLNEIKYDHVTVDGEVVEAVEIGELVKLYINHRPVQDCAEEDISRALRDVMLGQGQGEDTKSRNTYDTAMLLRQLQEHGEVFTDDELSHTIATLLEDHSPVTGSDGVLGERVSAREFVRNVLGMQEAAVEGV